MPSSRKANKQVREVVTPVTSSQEQANISSELWQEELLRIPQFGIPSVIAGNPAFFGESLLAVPTLRFNTFVQPQQIVEEPETITSQFQSLFIPPHAKDDSPTIAQLHGNTPNPSSSLLAQMHLHKRSMLQQHQNILNQPRQNIQPSSPKSVQQIQAQSLWQLGISNYLQPNHQLQQQHSTQRSQSQIKQQQHHHQYFSAIPSFEEPTTQQQQQFTRQSEMLRQTPAHQRYVGELKQTFAPPAISQKQKHDRTGSKQKCLLSSKSTNGAPLENTCFTLLPSSYEGDNVTTQPQKRNFNTSNSTQIDVERKLSDEGQAKRCKVSKLLEASMILDHDILHEKDSMKICMEEANITTNFRKLNDGCTESQSSAAITQTSSNFDENLSLATVSSVSALVANNQRFEHRKSKKSSKTACVSMKEKIFTNTNDQETKPWSHKRKIAKTFPQKLMEVLMNVPKGDNVVAWLPDGKSFVILDPDQFIKKHISSAFKQSKYLSFTRKLNRWGFVRMTSGTGTDCFHHPFFRKGRIDLCLEIVAVDGKNKAQMSAARKRLKKKRKHFLPSTKGGNCRGSTGCSLSRRVLKQPSLVGLDKIIKKK